MTTIAVVGGGLVGHLVCYELTRKVPSSLRIICLDGSDFYPSASLNSNAHSSLRNTWPGISPLGDALVAGHNKLAQFVNDHQPEGIATCDHIVAQINSPTLMDRYSNVTKDSYSIDRVGSFDNAVKQQAYIFTPRVFFDWLVRQSGCHHHKDYVVNVVEHKRQKYMIHGHRNSYLADYIFWCTGTGLLQHPQIKDKVVQNHKTSQGNYFEAHYNLGQKSFILEYRGKNLIYLAKEHKLQFGSTSFDEDESRNILCYSTSNLNENLKKFHEELKLDLNLPTLYWTQMGALRSKAKRRMPQVQWQKQMCSIYGMYKNGYTLAFDFIPKVIDQWISEHR